jgi:hypothetical protein
MTQDNSNGWVKLFSPENALITIPLDPNDPISAQQAANLLTSVRNLITAGFSVLEHGLDEGELSLTASLVSRRTAGDQTPIIDFFDAHPKIEKKVIHTYLNTPEDVAAFEKASGLKLSDIPEWDGELAISKTSAKAGKYIVKMRQPVKVIYTISQKWLEWNSQEQKTSKEPMKKILQRYETVSSPAPLAEQSQQSQSQQSQKAPMTFTIACSVKSPAGNDIGSLTREQLEALSKSQASNVTDEMRQAANVFLKSLAN